MLFGTFNILHPGHLSLFRQAKMFGDELFVVLARNHTVKQLKNYNPVDELVRRSKLLQLPMIDNVILGHSEDRMDAIKTIQPDVICLGYDQEFFITELEAFLDQEGIDSIVTRLSPYREEMYKSSKFV